MRQTRDVGAFDRIVFRSVGELYVEQGEPQAVVIEADEKVLARTKTEVRGGVLHIDAERTFSLLFMAPQRVRFYVTMPTIAGLDLTGAGQIEASRIETERLRLGLSGAGSVTVSDLQADALDVHLTGAGTVRVAGTVDELDVDEPGAGTFDGKLLRSRDATVRLSGVGRAEVWSEGALHAQLSGVGSLDCYGDHELTVERSGLGSVNSKGAPA